MIWSILGIEKTKDIKKIKSAYSSLAKQYNPEEHPDKFMEIHNAYREAMAYARNKAVISEADKTGEKIIIQNNTIIIEHVDIRKCDLKFVTGISKKKIVINDDSEKDDFDFSSLETFSKINEKEKPLSLSMIQDVILDDMKKIVNDKDMINSFYVWTSFFDNRVVCETLANPKLTDKIDKILNRKRFTKEVAELVSGVIGNKTRIIQNIDYGFHYIDVTGKRKLYYYIKSERHRKMTTAYNITLLILLFLLLLLALLTSYGII